MSHVDKASTMAHTSQIPLVDLRAAYRAHRDEFEAAVRGCVEGSYFIGGPDHKAFAAEFAEFCGGGHVALCANGTDAIYLALMAILGPGDKTGEIITVSHTFIGSAEPITLAGYRPVFVDVDSDSCVMDVSELERAITPKTKAIIPVHLYGQMAPMDRIMALARQHGLPVIEDAAQAHGAKWKGRGPGAWGTAACFSFYPGKNLGAWGDGGAVFTQDKDLAAKISMRANHGRMAKYEHSFEGVNSRLDGLQAAVLRVKLKYLADGNKARRQIAWTYDELLKGCPQIQRPFVRADAEHVFHLYVIQTDHRDEILKKMNAAGVDAGVHYPVPLHEQPAYAYLGLAPEILPITHRMAKRVLSLPIFPELTTQQAETVVRTLKEALEKH
jgi:dTDP-4-amino-4,6-dideoxygalactose transaminase